MNTIDWELTIDTIVSGKCILFLGPELYTNTKGEKLEDRLVDYLKSSDSYDGVKVYDDGLFFFKERQKRTETYLKIRRFFKEQDFQATNDIYEKIARIPFHFIIPTTPDHKLAEAFETNQVKVKEDFYQKKQAIEEKSFIPTKEVPLIYNMLGSIQHPESLVLTHNDLYDYFESIFQAKYISEHLKDHIINDALSIIFLGIPFERWYMQLILRFFHLHKDEEFMRFATSQSVSDEVETYCKEQFKMNFVTDNIADFIDEIYTRCQRNGLLREVNAEQQSLVDNLIRLLSLGKLSETLVQFKEWLDGVGNRGIELLDDVILLNNRYRRLNRKINQGVLNNTDAESETNKINVSLLELLHEAKYLE